MADASAKPSAVRSFPVTAVTIALALTLGLLGGLAWYVLDSYRYLETTQKSHFRLRELTGKILHLDEVLTMSARMAAASGDLRWEKRYLSCEPQLDAAIKEAFVLGEKFSIGEMAAKTDQANFNLVAMEYRAFDLVRRRQLKAAAAILSSAEYEKQKEIYRLGMEEITDKMNARLRMDFELQRRQVHLAIISVVVAVPCLVFAWIVVFRLARRNDAERRKAEETLRESEEKYRLVVENAEEAILVAQDGLLKYVNPMTLKILGYPEEALTSRPFAELIQPEDREKVFEAHSRRMKGEEDHPVRQFRFVICDPLNKLA